MTLVSVDPESSSMQSLISNNDLLTKEILVRLPVLSLVFCKSVSKHWRSLIKEANLTFCRNLDPPCGLFLEKYSQKNHISSFDFVPLDIRIPLLATNFTFGPEVQHIYSDYVEIFDSCNGFLLCRTYFMKLYVYNPSITNMFKVLPESDIVASDYQKYYTAGLKMAFDPTKSSNYKVIYAQIVGRSSNDSWAQIQTYSSKTGKWSLCGHQFPEHCFKNFEDGVYWNDAIYWINNKLEVKIFKLDIMDDHPVLTALQTPLTLDVKVHYKYSLFESRGCLLFVDKLKPLSQHFTIYEKGNGYSEWSVKYIVNLDDIIKPFPKSRWSECSNVDILYTVLGEREEDSFLVMRLDKKVVHYKIVSKTLNTIFDLGPDHDLSRCFQFIPSFAIV